MSVLLIAEHNNKEVKPFTQNAITAASQIDQDLHVLVIGKNVDEVINKLKENSFLIRKILSKKVFMKFLPKLLFRKDESFEYAEKIENLIKQTNK